MKNQEDRNKIYWGETWKSMGALLKKGEEDIPLALGSSACVISRPVVRQGTEIGGETASRARAKILIRGASILIRIKVTIT